jgi:predicted SAM-dependent methyltransferase
MPIEGGMTRLNLGCGDKILECYVNVDVVGERAGATPDISCDITDFSIFEGNYADEILVVHVVERFWRCELVDVLNEWDHVLCPGGKMILDCPILISACEAVLSIPELAALPGPEGERSMWIRYGD